MNANKIKFCVVPLYCTGLPVIDWVSKVTDFRQSDLLRTPDQDAHAWPG